MPRINHRNRLKSHLCAGAALLFGAAFSPAGMAQITSLELVQSIPTVGAFDMETFTIDGDRYMAITNYFDGSTRRLQSKIYRWSGASYFEIQSIPTFGATHWESFTIGGEHYLMVVNFRDGSAYALDSIVYRWNGSEFVEYQAIPTLGARNAEFFTMDGVPYLAVASHRNDTNHNLDSKLYRWDGGAFVEFQTIPTHGAADWHYFTADGQRFLAVANSYNNSSYNLDSMIYRWDGTQFTEFQAVPTHGGADWESFSIGGEQFLAVTNFRDNTDYSTNSTIYRWDGTRFSEYQALPTTGAFTFEHFSQGGDDYLVLGNYRNGTDYTRNSAIYHWDGGQFVIDETFPTSGNLDLAVYSEGTATYLAVSNYYNNSTYTLNSHLYRINATQLPIADFTATPVAGTAPLTVTLDASTATDPDGGAIVDYQWSSSDAQSATGSTASFTFDVAGSYSVTLTVTDDEGETAQQTIDIQVDAAVAGGNCEGRASYSAVDGRLHLPLMDIATVPLIGASGRPAGDSTVPTTATLRIIPGTTLFEIESVVSATPDPAAVDVCHADYSIDGVLTVPLVDVPVVTSIGGVTVTTSVETFSATLELLPMSDLFTVTEIRQLP